MQMMHNADAAADAAAAADAIPDDIARHQNCFFATTMRIVVMLQMLVRYRCWDKGRA